MKGERVGARYYIRHRSQGYWGFRKLLAIEGALSGGVPHSFLGSARLEVMGFQKRESTLLATFSGGGGGGETKIKGGLFG